MNDASIPARKAAVRAEVLARRDGLTPAAREAGSAAIAARVAPILAGLAAPVVGAYRAFGSEVDLAPAMAALHAGGGTVALPAMIDREHMVFRRARAGDPLAPDALGILAPPASAPVVEPNVLLVPVTGFDRDGGRLGKGRGVYDRAIREFRTRGRDPLLVGIAFSVQEVPLIPREPHDVRLDWIVTETLTLSLAKASSKRD